MKLIASVVLGALVASLASSHAQTTQSQLEVTVSDLREMPGERGSVAIAATLQDAEAAALVLRIQFDTQYVDAVEVTPGEALARFDKHLDSRIAEDRVTLVIHGGEPITDGGELAHILFDISASAPPEYQTALEDGGSSASTMDAESIPVAFNEGLILIEPNAHRADINHDGIISEDELFRGAMLYLAGAYHCDIAAPGGYAAGPGLQSCIPHSSDFAPQDWSISLSEYLRLVQLHNAGGYRYGPGEDGFVPESP